VLGELSARLGYTIACRQLHPSMKGCAILISLIDTPRQSTTLSHSISRSHGTFACAFMGTVS
jgi:hypothetical protein